MRVLNNELIVRRNETFTLDRFIVNRDGSPYIISNAMVNPYFVITVANTLYDSENRFVQKFWLPVTTPRFENTNPINLGEFKKREESDNPDSPLIRSYYSWSDLEGLPSGYYNGALVTFETSDEAVFYLEDEEGNREYRYFDDHKLAYVPYECRLIFKFLQAYTKEWVERSYYYNIDLVDGNLANNAGVNEPPLSAISEVIPILEPTKLSVLSNLKGGM